MFKNTITDADRQTDIMQDLVLMLKMILIIKSLEISKRISRSLYIWTLFIFEVLELIISSNKLMLQLNICVQSEFSSIGAILMYLFIFE